MNNTIMIVDDAKSNIYMLADILNSKYKLMPVTSGEDAIKIMRQKQPDLVLLDISMPGMDGFAVLKHMKEQKELANIPVIFITSEHDVNAEEKGLLLGAVDYIKKPYVAAIVDAKVQNHMELKSYRDNLEILVRQRTEKIEEYTRELEHHTKELEKRTAQLAASRETIIMGMSLMSECHDSVTGKHIERIKYFTEVLVNKLLAFSDDYITPELGKQIVLFSPLHDVGKIGISDTILKKTGTLTPEEFDIMKSHTIDGSELLKETAHFLVDGNDVNDLQVAIEIALHHHEKYDGTGYPARLKGGDIPISARIVAIADVYDALRSPRPYKKAFTHVEAVKIITEGDGRTERKHFDPKVLEAFISTNAEFDKIYMQSVPAVKLAN